MSKRIKSGLAVTSAHLELCDDNLRRAGADSRNEFVEKAIEFYSGYLTAEQNPQFFEEVFTSSAVKKMEQMSKTVGTGHYKMAVELSKLCNLIAAQMNLSDDELWRLHRKCSEEVKSLGSVPTFGQAYRYQHDEQD